MMLTLVAIALQTASAPPPGQFTIVFTPRPEGRALTPERERVVDAVAAAMRADPDAAVIVESRGWGGFENYSPAACHWPRVAWRRLVGLGIDPARIALRAPRQMAWERAPRDTEQGREPRLDFRLASLGTAANVRVMPDSCLSRLRP